MGHLIALKWENAKKMFKKCQDKSEKKKSQIRCFDPGMSWEISSRWVAFYFAELLSKLHR